MELRQSLYGEHLGWAAGNAFDSLTMISNAIAEVGTDNIRIRDYLRNIKDYSGATGTYSASAAFPYGFCSTITG